MNILRQVTETERRTGPVKLITIHRVCDIESPRPRPEPGGLSMERSYSGGAGLPATGSYSGATPKIRTADSHCAQLSPVRAYTDSKGSVVAEALECPGRSWPATAGPLSPMSAGL